MEPIKEVPNQRAKADAVKSRHAEHLQRLFGGKAARQANKASDRVHDATQRANDVDHAERVAKHHHVDGANHDDAAHEARAQALPTLGRGHRELSAEDQQKLRELQSRDTEVRAHESAHLAAAGGAAVGGPSFSYQTGPDGRQYAIGGEVPIDLTPASSPDATLAKARAIAAAAMAPAAPSDADRAIAAAAQRMASAAMAAIAGARSETATVEGLGATSQIAADVTTIEDLPNNDQTRAAKAYARAPVARSSMVCPFCGVSHEG